MHDEIHVRAEGHVVIRDGDTGDVLLEKKNAIHFENLAEALALCLANRANGHIHEMAFGNGASTVSGTGAVTYFPPNSAGADATLYNETYAKVVDDLSPLNADPDRNHLRVTHVQGATYADVVVTCWLDYAEPSGQEAFDDATNVDGHFIFDEIGLRSYGTGRLLTHCIFSPFQKALNRAIEVIYTVRLFMA